MLAVHATPIACVDGPFEEANLIPFCFRGRFLPTYKIEPLYLEADSNKQSRSSHLHVGRCPAVGLTQKRSRLFSLEICALSSMYFKIDVALVIRRVALDCPETGKKIRSTEREVGAVDALW